MSEEYADQWIVSEAAEDALDDAESEADALRANGIQTIGVIQNPDDDTITVVWDDTTCGAFVSPPH